MLSSIPIRWVAGMLAGFLLAAPAWGRVDRSTRYLGRSASILGPTGWINIPSAYILSNGEMAAAIHSGQAKFNFGLLDMLEAGIYFSADTLGQQFEPYRNLSSWEQVQANVPPFLNGAFRGQVKVRLLDEDWAGVSFAVGREQGSNYLVAQKYLSALSRVNLVGGWGQGRFQRGFIGLGKTITSGAELMFEYDGEGVNVGLRLLLGANLVFSFAGMQLNTIGEVEHLSEVIRNHMIWGVTYVERLW